MPAAKAKTGARSNYQGVVTVPPQTLTLLEQLGYRDLAPDYYLVGGGVRRKNQPPLCPGPAALSENRLHDTYRKALARAGVVLPLECALYSWKENGVQDAVAAGIHPKAIQQQLRHLQPGMVDRYLKRYRSQVRPEYQRWQPQ